MKEVTRENIILQIEKKLNDAYKLALENKGLIGSVILADSIQSLKLRWCIKNVPAAKRKLNTKSRAITFTKDDFDSKKKENLVEPVADKWKGKSLSEIKVMAKEFGIGLKGKDREQLIGEIEWEQAEARANKNKAVSEEE